MVKDKIREIILHTNNILKVCERQIKTGILAYRDLEDGVLRFETQEFTEKVEKLEEFLTDLVDTGGGDLPEDLIGALEKLGAEFTFRNKADEN